MMLCNECGRKVTQVQARYRKTIKGAKRIVCEQCDHVMQRAYEALRKDKDK